MRYLSVCSGIEAATCAWHDMGWTPVAFSEIEPFPSAVLKHHYPNVPNLGDMTKYKEWELDSIGLLVGGTPCQSFSVAGLRKGLEDPRGNLMLTYCGLLDKFRPKWFVWENVPGVLSSNGGRDFGSFLGAVAELGYGWAYRVLDAQYFGVAQRRRRVFVVGCFGDWGSAAKVLFESESLRRDIKPSREKRKEITASSGIGVEITGPLAARRFAETDGLSEISAQMIAVPPVANCLQTSCNDYSRADGFNMICTEITGPLTARDYKGISGDDCNPTMAKMVAYRKSRRAQSKDDYETWVNDGKANTINTFDLGDIRTTHAIALQGAGATSQNVNGNGYKENQSFTLNTTDVHGVAYAFEPGKLKRLGQVQGPEICTTLRADMGDNQTAVAHTFKIRGGKPGGGKGYLGQDESAYTVSTVQDQSLLHNMAVRRLTPIECERLQGFTDDYTMIPWKKGESPDGLRYKALGNSMAVPCMKWIGERINEINQQT
jgi:DNA (cytosine-5)-methyltransferase 1